LPTWSAVTTCVSYHLLYTGPIYHWNGILVDAIQICNPVHA